MAMRISNLDSQFLTRKRIDCLNCQCEWPFCNILRNFFNKKFLDLYLEYTLNSTGHSEQFDFFDSCLLCKRFRMQMYWFHENINEFHLNINSYIISKNYTPISIIYLNALLK